MTSSIEMLSCYANFDLSFAYRIAVFNQNSVAMFSTTFCEEFHLFLCVYQREDNNMKGSKIYIVHCVCVSVIINEMFT